LALAAAIVVVMAAVGGFLWLTPLPPTVPCGNCCGYCGAQETMTLGGSVAAYPFDQIAVTEFEQNVTGIAVSDNQGGTGPGIQAVCRGEIDIGVASEYESTSALVSVDGCPSTVIEETFAYDAVDLIVPSSNPHGLGSVAWDTLQAIYVAGSNGSSKFAVPNLCPTFANCTLDGLPTAHLLPAFRGTSPGLAWDQLPACVAGSDCHDTSEILEPVGFGEGTPQPCPDGSGSALCFPTGAGQASPCGWSVCAGGTGPGNASGEFGAEVQPWAWSGFSAPLQTFEARILAIGASPAGGLGFAPCAAPGYLSNCSLEVPADHSVTNTSQMLSGVAEDPDAIGFAPEIPVQSEALEVRPLAFEGYGQRAAVEVENASEALTATAAGVRSAATGTWGPHSYVGWIPFVYVEIQPATGGWATQYLHFVLNEANNQRIAAASGELSLYPIAALDHLSIPTAV
jgi:ABC-type phosphate transport system substrate-binding protein